jgi:membrane-associated protease RseP (regulator of RpoE activity)
MAFLNALIAFIVTIGILVTVHEFGYFWVAKKTRHQGATHPPA